MNSPRHVLMLDSLAGLSVGDSFGEQFRAHPEDIPCRVVSTRTWSWTDDTEMAIGLASVLIRNGQVDQDELAQEFAREFNPRRRYGPAMEFDWILRMQRGDGWRSAAGSLFAGNGSYGNGAAMRVAPLGAFFSHDLAEVVAQARLSAEVTHAHSEGIAGAIAVALAAAFAARQRGERLISGPRSLIAAVIPHVPESEVRRRLTILHDQFGPQVSLSQIAEAVGNGDQVSAQDTVPFCLWAAGRYLDSYEDALWQTVKVFGDLDTNCAIVGGIVAAHVGAEGIPFLWLESREAIPNLRPE